MQLFILHVYVYVTVVCMCLSVECVYVSLRHVCVGGDKVISAIRISQWISIIRFCQEKQLSSYISYKHIEGPPPVSIDRNTSNLHTHTHICTHILNYSSCIALAQFVWRWEIDFQSFLSRFRLLILCMHNCICFCNKEERASCVHVQRPKANSSSTTNLQWIKYLFSRNNVITNCLGDYCVLIQHYCLFFDFFAGAHFTKIHISLKTWNAYPHHRFHHRFPSFSPIMEKHTQFGKGKAQQHTAACSHHVYERGFVVHSFKSNCCFRFDAVG